MANGQYIWRTVKDDRVRPEHAAREGQIFSWTDPPDDGHPGEAFGCRCWAEPVEQTAEGLTQEVISPVNDASRKWTTIDFAKHFAFGRGRTVTLSEIGYLGDIISAARQIMFEDLEEQIADRMRQIKSGPLAYRTENSYDFTGVHWVLGRGTIKTQTVGEVKQSGNILTIEATVAYSYSDEITDPIDLRQIYRGPHQIKDLPNSPIGGLELFVTDLLVGTAYSITGSWKTKLTGSISMRE